MELWEAIKELENGAKIRKSNWPKDIYMHLVPDEYDEKPTLKIVGSPCYMLKHYNFRYYLGNDWEIL